MTKKPPKMTVRKLCGRAVYTREESSEGRVIYPQSESWVEMVKTEFSEKHHEALLAIKRAPELSAPHDDLAA